MGLVYFVYIVYSTIVVSLLHLCFGANVSTYEDDVSWLWKQTSLLLLRFRRRIGAWLELNRHSEVYVRTCTPSVSHSFHLFSRESKKERDCKQCLKAFIIPTTVLIHCKYSFCISFACKRDLMFSLSLFPSVCSLFSFFFFCPFLLRTLGVPISFFFSFSLFGFSTGVLVGFSLVWGPDNLFFKIRRDPGGFRTIMEPFWQFLELRAAFNGFPRDLFRGRLTKKAMTSTLWWRAYTCVFSEYICQYE